IATLALFSRLTPQLRAQYGSPPNTQPPGTPIPPTPFPDGTSAPSPFYPPTDIAHLTPNDSGRRASLAFVDPYGTPPASPRFAPGPPGTGSPPVGYSSGGGGGGGVGVVGHKGEEEEGARG
ncbi:hypothetical protein BGX38DRAFT_1281494, partial [Terfezia claveryi]